MGPATWESVPSLGVLLASAGPSVVPAVLALFPIPENSDAEVGCRAVELCTRWPATLRAALVLAPLCLLGACRVPSSASASGTHSCALLCSSAAVATIESRPGRNAGEAQDTPHSSNDTVVNSGGRCCWGAGSRPASRRNGGVE